MPVKSVSVVSLVDSVGHTRVAIQINVVNKEGYVDHRESCAYSPMGGDRCTCGNSQNVTINVELAFKLYEELATFWREGLVARASGNNTNGWRDVAADALREDRIQEVIDLLAQYAPEFGGVYAEMRTALIRTSEELTKTKELLVKERNTTRTLGYND